MSGIWFELVILASAQRGQNNIKSINGWILGLVDMTFKYESEFWVSQVSLIELEKFVYTQFSDKVICQNNIHKPEYVRRTHNTHTGMKFHSEVTIRTTYFVCQFMFYTFCLPVSLDSGFIQTLLLYSVDIICWSAHLGWQMSLISR